MLAKSSVNSNPTLIITALTPESRSAQRYPKSFGIVPNRTESFGVIRSLSLPESSGVVRSRPESFKVLRSRWKSESSEVVRSSLKSSVMNTANESGRLLATPDGTSGSDFDDVGIEMTIAGVGSKSWVRSNEHITNLNNRIAVLVLAIHHNFNTEGRKKLSKRGQLHCGTDGATSFLLFYRMHQSFIIC